MKNETIEKRINEYTFSKYVHLLLALGFGFSAVFVRNTKTLETLQINIAANMLSFFFLGMYWRCCSMLEMYKDMKEN